MCPVRRERRSTWILPDPDGARSKDRQRDLYRLLGRVADKTETADQPLRPRCVESGLPPVSLRPDEYLLLQRGRRYRKDRHDEGRTSELVTLLSFWFQVTGF